MSGRLAVPRFLEGFEKGLICLWGVGLGFVGLLVWPWGIGYPRPLVLYGSFEATFEVGSAKM